ncbi:hypothetical protein NKH18_01335 [Streptomyces sp. M10(2022)]
MIDRGLDAHDIAGELHGLAPDWLPARPVAYITTALARDEGQTVGHTGTRPSEAFSRAVADLREGSTETAEDVPVVDADGFACGVEGLMPEEVIDLRSSAAADPAWFSLPSRTSASGTPGACTRTGSSMRCCCASSAVRVSR